MQKESCPYSAITCPCSTLPVRSLYNQRSKIPLILVVRTYVILLLRTYVTSLLILDVWWFYMLCDDVIVIVWIYVWIYCFVSRLSNLDRIIKIMNGELKKTQFKYQQLESWLSHLSYQKDNNRTNYKFIN